MPAISTILSESETAPNPPLIDRSLVEDYCKKNSMSVHGLLDGFVKDGVNNFSDYLREVGLNLNIPADARGILHGSQNLFPQFEPRVSKGGPNANKHEPLVYASDDPNYAIFLGIVDLKAGSAGTGYVNGEIQCRISKEFVNGP